MSAKAVDNTFLIAASPPLKARSPHNIEACNVRATQVKQSSETSHMQELQTTSPFYEIEDTLLLKGWTRRQTSRCLQRVEA